MNWTWPFARQGGESKAAMPLFALSHPGGAVWGGRDAAALTRDGYLRNAVAYRCVRMVAEAAAAVPLVSSHAGVASLLRAPAPGARWRWAGGDFEHEFCAGNGRVRRDYRTGGAVAVALAQLVSNGGRFLRAR